MKASVTAFVIAVVGQATALGINCRGSSNCGLGIGNVMQKIHDGLAARNSNDFWGNGQHIYCSGSFCAFYQNLPNNQYRTSDDALGHIQNLINHGCKVCGSDPITDNDVSKGQLTVNYVSNP